MKKMKKWELLKKAYETYPAGTIARFKSAPRVEHISDGTFKITEDRDNGICVVSGNDQSCFYAERDANTEEKIEEWATPDEIQEPKKEFAMMSKDGVTLNRGSYYHRVSLGKEWYYDHEGPYSLDEHHRVITDPDTNQAFTTKEAAMEWCNKQNKPKEIILFQDTDFPVIVRKDYCQVLTSKSPLLNADIRIIKEEFQQISEAFNKLQS